MEISTDVTTLSVIRKIAYLYNPFGKAATSSSAYTLVYRNVHTTVAENCTSAYHSERSG